MPIPRWCPLWVLVLTTALFSGCTAPFFLTSDSDNDEMDQVVERYQSEGGVRLVGDLAAPFGLAWMKVEGVALVTNLKDSGSDPPPSPLREKLIKEMQTHDVKHYSRALASSDTSMVIVRGYVPPGALKGDVFDVEVRIPYRSKTTSLENGWLMQARLREFQVLDTVREGHVAALSSGSILVDAVFDASDDSIEATRGRIPGGGVVQKPRTIGLAIRENHSSVRTSAMIGAAINERFHHYDRGSKKGVANPKRDNMLDLAVHPRYRNNLGRYIRVIRSIAVGESPAERSLRLTTLRHMLLEPTSAETAALQLEAIGNESRAILLDGLKSSDPEVVFYSAEALAYLDQSEAAEPLREAAEQERAFRWRAMAALAAMDSYEAQDMLASLLHVPSAETRYGAFRALRLRNPRDPLVRGEVLNREFAYHRVTSKGEPLIHFSRTRRPELVVFGDKVRIQPVQFFYVGESIIVKSLEENTLQISCFRAGEEDKFEQCTPELDDLIKALTRVGAHYGEIYEGLQTAKSRGFLNARLEVDALPRGNRRYSRQDDGEGSGIRVNNPVPDGFMDLLGSDDDPHIREDSGLELPVGGGREEATESSFFDKMTDWMVTE